MHKLLFVFVLLLHAGTVQAQDTLPVAPNAVQPLMVGDEMPALSLVDVDGNPFDLGAHKKPTVLIFYRGYW